MMNRNDRFDAIDNASDDTAAEHELQSLFQRTAPDLGPLDVDALFARSEGAHLRRWQVLALPRWRTARDLAWAALGIGNSSSTRLTRSTIMRARIAAAVVLVGGISALLLILGQSGTNPLIASVQEKLKEVRSVTFDVSVQRGDAPAETVHVKLLGEDLGRAEKPSGEFTVFDRKQRKMMEVTPDERKAVIRTSVEGENPIPNLFDMLLRASEKSVKELGDRKIDGKNVTGFVAELRGQEMDVWVDPATKLPVQIEQRQKLRENIASRDPKTREQKVPETGAVVETVSSKFVYNAKLDPAQFRIAPPKGYAVEMRDLPTVEELSRRALEQERKALEQAREAARAGRERKKP